MIKQTEFKRVERRKYLDMPLEEGVLYLSSELQCAKHICPCGCGNEVYIYFNVASGWSISENEGKITISPSLLNPCGAHYFIRDNKIVWV